MSSVRDAELVEAANPVYLHLSNGNLVNLTNLREFYVQEMNSLSNVYRWAAKVDFSVADHIRLGWLFCNSVEQSKAWALHESWESLTLDVPKPLKQTWPWYVEQENKYLEFVFQLHNLDYNQYTELVSPIDELCWGMERSHFFKNEPSYEIQKIKQTPADPLAEQVMKLFPEIYRKE
jgi:hypothetical protein